MIDILQDIAIVLVAFSVVITNLTIRSIIRREIGRRR